MDLTKRMQKRAAHVLEPGEHYVGALSVGPPGATAYSANPGGATGAVGAFARAAEDAAADPGVWLDVPMEGFILGLTNRRLLIFDQSFLGLPQELLVEAPRANIHLEIDHTEAGPFGRARTYHLRTDQGQYVSVEANTSGPAATRADRFEAAWAATPEGP